MALKACRECSQTVSTEAAACPHCGAVSPAGTAKQTPQKAKKSSNPGLLATLLVVGGAIALFGNLSGSSNSPSSSTPAAAPAAPGCKDNWKLCKDNADVVNNHSGMYKAKSACKDSAIKIARYGTPEFPWFSFGSFVPGTTAPSTGAITIVEPDAQFSNGFNAKMHMQVRCAYNLATDTVTDVRILENR